MKNITHEERIKIQEATSKYISSIEFDFLVTLHFNLDIEKTKARETLLKFLNKLNAHIFGSRSKKSLIQVCFVEKNTYRNTYHIHMLCKKPDLSRVLEPKDEIAGFKKIVREIWRDAGPLTSVKDLKLDTELTQWFKPIYKIDGVSSYLTKQINSGNLDVVEWDKANIKGRKPRNF